jgi:hypothetical protein
MKLNLKLTKRDMIAIGILAAFVLISAFMVYTPKDSCEVARGDYECSTVKVAMSEYCAYWGKYSCDTSTDVSLPDVEWFIGNMCNLQNQYHGTGLDCSNLKSACNKITGIQTCPVGL